MASPIGQQTGTSAEDNFTEARRILVDLDLIRHTDEMRPHEANFVEQMFAQVEEGKWALSGKQLFWLRDLKDKYCV